jgi:hypothetical protein
MNFGGTRDPSTMPLGCSETTILGMIPANMRGGGYRVEPGVVERRST